jgi:hypothetical protein
MEALSELLTLTPLKWNALHVTIMDLPDVRLTTQAEHSSAASSLPSLVATPVVASFPSAWKTVRMLIISANHAVKRSLTRESERTDFKTMMTIIIS